MTLKIVSQGEKETLAVSREFAKLVRALKNPGAVVVALIGDLGSGKTTFARGFVRAFGVRRRVASPTFLIMRRFPAGRRDIWHIDCYRIRSRDLVKLNFLELCRDRRNIILVEWADRVKSLLPKNAIKLRFAHGRKENIRIITINAPGSY